MRKIALLVAAGALLGASTQGLGAQVQAYTRKKEEQDAEAAGRRGFAREPITLAVPPLPLEPPAFTPSLTRRRQAWNDPATAERRQQIKQLLNPIRYPRRP